MFHGLIEFFSTNVFLNFFVPITGSRTLWMRKYNLIGSPFVFFSFLCLLFISYIQSLPLSFRYVGTSLLATFPFYIKLVFFIILFPPPGHFIYSSYKNTSSASTLHQIQDHSSKLLIFFPFWSIRIGTHLNYFD